MSSKSKNYIPQGNKSTKLKKISSVPLHQIDRQSASNPLVEADTKIEDVLKAYTDCNNGLPNIRIIVQTNPLSNCIQQNKDESLETQEYTEPIYVTEEFNQPSVFCYARNENEGPLRVSFKNGINEHIVPVLTLITPYFKHLLVLQLVYCGLQDAQLSLVQTILLDYTNIKFLSLDGNPLLLQSYSDILLTNLTNLSLRSCQIKIDGVKNIIEQLQDCNLVSLNLSSNFLDDECLKFLSSPLRFNRKLSTLNLSDNWFTDIGLIDFIKIFKKFKLEESEIILRRRLNLVYLRDQKEIVNDLLSSGSKSMLPDILTKSFQLPVRKSRPYVTYEAQRLADPKTVAMDTAKERIKTKIITDNYPLIVECFPEDKAIYCQGNFTIATLNILSNNITSLSLKEFIDILKYQFEFYNDNKCLQTLGFDDNLNSKYPMEVLQISELLNLNNRMNTIKSTSKIRSNSLPGGTLR